MDIEATILFKIELRATICQMNCSYSKMIFFITQNNKPLFTYPKTYIRN